MGGMDHLLNCSFVELFIKHVGVAKVVRAFTSESFVLLTNDPALDDSMLITRFVLSQVFSSLKAYNMDVLVLLW